jgi:diguanylate cyclase (GGDEF)-like protein
LNTTFGNSTYRIANIQLFRAIDDPHLAQHLINCPIIEVKAGQTVPARHLLIVLKGALAATLDGQPGVLEGNASKIVAGESIGELSVLDDAAETLQVMALEDSELLQISGDKLWQMIDGCNGMARNLLRLLSFRIRTANAQLRRKQKVGEFYRQMSMNDGLTGLYNRAWLDQALPNLVQSAQENHEALAIIMIDLDHFKRFNDTHGHQAGDQALRCAAQVLLAALRPTDFAARYGGEELMVVLPNTRETMAVMVAQRLCARMQEAQVLGHELALPHITASFGVAALAAGQHEAELVAAADAALYRAKEHGRNRVSL